MSNFLNNLVARTLALAPVVQPRITSRFEPPQMTTTAEPPEQVVEVKTPPQPQVTNIFESHITEPAPVVIAPPVDYQQVINTVRNTYVESHEVVQNPIIEKVHERTHTETRIHTEKSTDSRLEIRENRILEPPPREVEKNPSNPRLNKPEPAPVAKEAPVPTPPPIVPRVITRIEPAPVAKAPRFEVPPVIQPEPTETINVTIGRVDVRAVFSAQAPSAPRTRAASVNSLDDYLKQRSEGRR